MRIICLANMIGVGRICIVLTFIYNGVLGQLIGTKFPFILDSGSSSRNESTRGCNTEEIVHKLTQFEVQVGVKSEYLNLELQKGNKRLQALESELKEFREKYGKQEAPKKLSEEIRKILKEFQDGNGILETIENANGKVDLTLEEIRKINGRLQAFEIASDELRTAFGNISREVGLAIKELREENDRIQVLESFGKEAHTAIEELRKGNGESQSLEHDSEEIRTAIKEIKEQLRQLSNFSSNTVKKLPGSCKEILERDRNSKSGLYRIQPENSLESFMVRCDMTTKGGGWTYIHNRYDGTQDFYLGIKDYIMGFGNLAREFWLGLEYIYYLTSNGTNELLVELVDEKGVKVYAQYTDFSIDKNSENYPLNKLGKYSGDAGDSLTIHVGNKFSTKDLDLDTSTMSCATVFKGAWWYSDCYNSNLNGLYKSPGTVSKEGMNWNDLKKEHSLKEARMLIR